VLPKVGSGKVQEHSKQQKCFRTGLEVKCFRMLSKNHTLRKIQQHVRKIPISISFTTNQSGNTNSNLTKIATNSQPID
jgi:hypothetical protein